MKIPEPKIYKRFVGYRVEVDECKRFKKEFIRKTSSEAKKAFDISEEDIDKGIRMIGVIVSEDSNIERAKIEAKKALEHELENYNSKLLD